jgi:hypothetical protein
MLGDVSDVVALALTVVGFASLVTVHVAIVFALAFRAPRWRAVVAFFVPPFAPYHAFGERLYVRGALWIAALVVYGVGFFFARR